MALPIELAEIQASGEKFIASQRAGGDTLYIGNLGTILRKGRGDKWYVADRPDADKLLAETWQAETN